ncbi:MAG: hypothetical protein IRZ19_08430 [Pyrinomonas methylaliphatogenes]|nr:hypothetical protein [Pyrinomonas methylaliphatogenes]
MVASELGELVEIAGPVGDRSGDEGGGAIVEQSHTTHNEAFPFHHLRSAR